MRDFGKTHQIAYTYCSVGISDLKPLTGTSADQLPHRKSRSVATKVAVFKAITLTIEPKPAGPTFARCALRGAHAGPNGLPMDTNIYIYLYIYIYIYIYIPENCASQLVHIARFARN